MELITVTEAMRRLSIGRTTVYKLIHDGRLKSVTIGRSRRIRLDSIDGVAGGDDE